MQVYFPELLLGCCYIVITLLINQTTKKLNVNRMLEKQQECLLNVFLIGITLIPDKKVTSQVNDITPNQARPKFCKIKINLEVFPRLSLSNGSERRDY